MISGRIDIPFTQGWYKLLDYKEHHSPLSGFNFVDTNDRDRYKPEQITSHIHHGLEEYQEIFFKEYFFRVMNPMFAIHKMLPGMLLPRHVDSYNYFLKSNPGYSVQEVIRIIVFLEDWDSGHISEVSKDSHSSWKQGDWFFWMGQTPHMAANLGHADRYTLQITGTVR